MWFFMSFITANLERIVNGQLSEEVMMACDEQVGISETDDEAGASQAVQMFRALKNKNITAVRNFDDKVECFFEFVVWFIFAFRHLFQCSEAFIVFLKS